MMWSAPTYLLLAVYANASSSGSLELNQVPSNSQAQRLAKIYMSKRNPKWSGQVRTNFAGLNAIGQSAVNLSFDELDQPAGTSTARSGSMGR